MTGSLGRKPLAAWRSSSDRERRELFLSYRTANDPSSNPATESSPVSCGVGGRRDRRMKGMGWAFAQKVSHRPADREGAALPTTSLLPVGTAPPRRLVLLPRQQPKPHHQPVRQRHHQEQPVQPPRLGQLRQP